MNAHSRRQRQLEGQIPIFDLGRPPIGDGEVRNTTIPDTLEGIRFEVDKLVDYVRYYRTDPIINDTVEKIAHACPSKDKTCMASAIFEWCKANFLFVNDPWAAEKVKTGRRMMRDLATPREVLAAILAPLLGRKVEHGTLPAVVVSSKFPSDPTELDRVLNDPSWVPSAKVVDDCDGAATFVATMIAAAGLQPQFVLGGRPNARGECEWHHIWVQAKTDQGWVNLDVSEPISTFGWSFPFKCSNIVRIFRD